jgi:spore germination protein KA
MRTVRIIGFFLTITVPGLYISIVAFHHEMMPTELIISIATERQGVPLPAALEAFFMLIVFDILKETGIRMPTNIGQALSILCALVIGQAAVEAKLVAAPMIVIIGLTGITNLMVPKLNAPVIYIRFLLLLLSSGFGFFGFVTGVSITVIHMINLRSFGIQQIMLSGNLQFAEVKDSFVRAPWHTMVLRPNFAKDRQRINNAKNNQN